MGHRGLSTSVIYQRSRERRLASLRDNAESRDETASLSPREKVI